MCCEVLCRVLLCYAMVHSAVLRCAARVQLRDASARYVAQIWRGATLGMRICFWLRCAIAGQVAAADTVATAFVAVACMQALAHGSHLSAALICSAVARVLCPASCIACSEGCRDSHACACALAHHSALLLRSSPARLAQEPQVVAPTRCASCLTPGGGARQVGARASGPALRPLQHARLSPIQFWVRWVQFCVLGWGCAMHVIRWHPRISPGH